MDTAEIVVHKPKGNGGGMILNLLVKGICEASKSANAHPHREILALNKTGAHMLRIGIAADCFHIAADARCWRIARMVLIGSAVNLLQLGIVAIHAERAFDCL